MKPPSSDRTPEAEQVQLELLRKMPAWKKLKLICELIQETRQSMLADLRRRFPMASEEELRRRFIARVLTRDEVIRTYGFDPEAEGYNDRQIC